MTLQQNKPFDAAELFRDRSTRYEYTYARYLDFFKMLANSSAQIDVLHPPQCWCPLIYYLGHDVIEPQHTPPIDLGYSTDWATAYHTDADKRRVVEVSSTCRPELTHALYLIDTEWQCPRRNIVLLDEFNVTCNGSFFRPEVQAFRALLGAFTPEKTKCVIVPCAADKPYPSLVHRAVRARVPADWELIVVSGVLGLLPEGMWPVAPVYDAGIPNLGRITQTVSWYFTKWADHYEKVVVYSEFCASAIYEGLYQNGCGNYRGDVEFAFGHYPRDSYENLLLPEHLDRLECLVRKR